MLNRFLIGNLMDHVGDDLRSSPLRQEKLVPAFSLQRSALERNQIVVALYVPKETFGTRGKCILALSF
jgi:hypothetical protein